jgi:clan AA aspartic protease (TIGR02281 family)
MHSRFHQSRLCGRLIVALATACLAAGCLPAGAAPPAAHPAHPAPPPAITAVPMTIDGGVYVIPVSVNGVAMPDCIVDSGASDVNVPADVFRKLVRAGKIQKGDFLGTQDYTLADGSTEHGRTFLIRSLKVGNIEVKDVIASVGGDGSSALLGQSFFSRFGSWSQDNGRHALLLVGPPSAPPRAVPQPHPNDGPPSVANDGGGHHVGAPPPVGGTGHDTDGPPPGTTVAQTPTAHAPDTSPDTQGSEAQTSQTGGGGSGSDTSDTSASQNAPDPSDDSLTAQQSSQ